MIVSLKMIRSVVLLCSLVSLVPPCFVSGTSTFSVCTVASAPPSVHLSALRVQEWLEKYACPGQTFGLVNITKGEGHTCLAVGSAAASLLQFDFPTFPPGIDVVESFALGKLTSGGYALTGDPKDTSLFQRGTLVSTISLLLFLVQTKR